MHSRFSVLIIGTLALVAGDSAFGTLADYQAAVTNETSLVSYYRFDATNANDSLGQHNGTTQGGASFGPGIGNSGRSLLLNGAGRVNLGQVSDFDFADRTGSVEAWVRPGWTGTFSAYNPCIFADRNGGPVDWSVHMNGDKSGVGVWNGSSYSPLGIPAPGTNWHHLAVTFDNSSGVGEVSIYWDGALAGVRDQDLGGGSNPTQLGSSQASVTDEGWIGGLDEVAFYSEALSSNQVQAHFQALFSGTPPVIGRQPQGGTYLPGVNLQLRVSATGPNLSYQWFKDNSSLPGATSSVLTLGNLSAGNTGTYHVVVSNPGATVPSSNAAVALGTVISLPLAAYQAAVTNEPTLISYYEFDRLTPSDARQLHDGSLQDTAYFSAGVAGGPDQGLSLDGAGRLDLGAVSDFDFGSGTGTVEAWVRADWDSIGYNPCLFADRDGGTANWSIHLNSDKRGIGMWNGTTYQTFALPYAGSSWHHTAVVFDAGNFTLYWDGVPIGTMAQALGGTPASVQLGSSSASLTAEGWVGLLDEVAFYSSALPASSVQTHYRAYVGDTPPLISVQPVGGAFYPGRNLRLTVWASGADLTYQWIKDGQALPAATNWFLDFLPLAATNAGSYSVTISGHGQQVVSSTAVIQTGVKLTSYQAAVRGESSLISYYTFDASDSNDSKGTNNGVLTGTATFDVGVGQSSDKALLLDGSGSVSLGAVSDFEFTNGNGTAEAWIRPDWTSSPGYDPCVFADRSGGPTDWSIHMLRDRTGIGNWNGSHFQSLGLGDTTGWHHLAVAFGGSQVWMYWDGQLLGTFAQPIDLSTGLTSQIGSSADSTAEAWVGAIDEVAFYRSTLDANAIQNHFLAMVRSTQPPALSFHSSGSQLTLSWPPDATGFTLQAADDLPASTWLPVPNVTSNSVTVSTTGNHKYYRLSK